MPKKIIGLTYIHENQALEVCTQYFCDHFIGHGYPAIAIDLNSPSGPKRLEEELKSGAVDFCFGLQGVGSRLVTTRGTNIWTYYKTPFLCMHYDNPSCNIYNHISESPYVANLYYFDFLLEIQKKYVKSPHINERVPFKIGWEPLTEIVVPFSDRSIEIAFLKSGKSPLIYAQKINQINAPLRDAIWAVIQKAEKDENLLICELLSEAFLLANKDPTEFWAEFWGIADLIDNYIRCKRATDFVNWLKFQKGAVIIGNGWDFIDKENTQALFKPSLPFAQSLPIYKNAKFICNTSPYGSDMIHERVYSGLGYSAFVLSDTNSWWDNNFGDVSCLKLFRWGTDFISELEVAIHDPLAEEKVKTKAGVKRVEEKLSGHSQTEHIMKIKEKIIPYAEQIR